MLYKRKGPYDSADSWRPITIANSLAKMVDKTTLHYLNSSPDHNYNNHAYIHSRSCLTAILKIQEYMQRFRDTISDDKDHDYIPIILCEDIKSAFESIDSELIEMVLEHKFDMTHVKLFYSLFQRKKL